MGKLRLNIWAHKSALEAMVFRCGPVCDATHLIICRINYLLAVRPSIQPIAMQCARTLRFTTTCAWICWPSIYRVYLKCVDEDQGSVPPTKARKNLISIYVRKHVIFKLQPPRSPGLSPLDFYPWGFLNSQCIQLKLKTDKFQNEFLMLI